MATKYVSNSIGNGFVVGLDTNNGNGPTTPYLTINKGLTSLGLTGDTLIVNPGTTYVETSGSGYLNIGNAYTSTTFVQSAVAGTKVVISGTSGTIDVQINNNSANMAWTDFTFQGTLSASAFRFGSRTISAYSFTNCAWIALNATGSHAMDTAGGTCSVTGITFNTCTFTQSNTNITSECMFIQTGAASVYSGWVFNRCVGISAGNNVGWFGQGSYTFNGGSYTGAQSHGLYFGTDGATTTFNATGVLNGVYTSLPALGHAIIFGAGALNCVASRCVNDGTQGDSWVLKSGQVENNNHVISDCLIRAPQGSVPNFNLLFKGGKGNTAVRNVIYVNNTLNGQAVGNYDSAGSPFLSTNITYEFNYHIVRGKYGAVIWSSLGDAVSNPNLVTNYNTYEIWTTEGANYGTANNVTGIATLAALQAAWSGYTPTGNDAQSSNAGTSTAESLIVYQGASSGLQLYFQIVNQNGGVWNGSAFEFYNPANWLNYSIPMIEHPVGSKRYFWPFPVNVPGGNYFVNIYQVAVASWGYQASTDTQVNLSATNGGQAYQWGGVSTISLAGINSKLNLLVAVSV